MVPDLICTGGTKTVFARERNTPHAQLGWPQQPYTRAVPRMKPKTGKSREQAN